MRQPDDWDTVLTVAACVAFVAVLAGWIALYAWVESLP